MSPSSKVSVCIPTYQHAVFLPTAIESVLRQTFEDFELIVVDNASTDNTEEVVSRYVKSDPRVRYFRNASNLGMVGNWNKCLEYSAGDYVKILCSDDVLAPECLQVAVEALDRLPNVGLVTCGRQVVDENLGFLHVLQFSETAGVWSGEDAIRRSLEKLNPIGEPTAVVFRRRLAARGFNPLVNQLADIEMWLHILQQSDLYFDPRPLCQFRQHPNQCTQENVKSLRVIEEEFAIVEGLENFLRQNYSITFIAKVRFLKALNAWRFLKTGHSREAICSAIDRHYGLIKFRLLYPFRSLIKRF